jgi:predicted double-glycine peptidase
MTPKTVHPVGLLVFFIAVTGLLPAALAADLPFSSSGVSGSKRVKTLKELRSEDIIQQSLDFSCGPAALATILSYYFKDPVQEKDIIRYLLISGDVKKIKQRKGFSMLDLKRYCTYRGYQVTGYRGDLEFFAKLK